MKRGGIGEAVDEARMAEDARTQLGPRPSWEEGYARPQAKM